MLQMSHPSNSFWKDLYFRTFGYPHVGSHIRAEAVFSLLDWGAGARILDAGCGQGHFSYDLLKRAYRTVMVDWMEESKPQAMRDVARAFGKGRAPFRFLGGDLRHLPFPDGTFDGVLCADVLEHIPEDEAALRELVRILKPGGSIVVSTPAAGFHRGRFKSAFRWLYLRTFLRKLPFWDPVYLFPESMMRSKGHLREYTLEMWRERCRRCGLELEDFRWEYKAFGAFFLEVCHSFAPLHSMGPAQAIYFAMVNPWTKLDRLLPVRGTGIAFRARKKEAASAPSGENVPSSNIHHKTSVKRE